MKERDAIARGPFCTFPPGEGPIGVWVSDITFIWTREGWMYLAVILDAFNRQMVGWSVSDTTLILENGTSIHLLVLSDIEPLIFSSARRKHLYALRFARPFGSPCRGGQALPCRNPLSILS